MGVSDGTKHALTSTCADEWAPLARSMCVFTFSVQVYLPIGARLFKARLVKARLVPGNSGAKVAHLFRALPLKSLISSQRQSPSFLLAV